MLNIHPPTHHRYRATLQPAAAVNDLGRLTALLSSLMAHLAVASSPSLLPPRRGPTIGRLFAWKHDISSCRHRGRLCVLSLRVRPSALEWWPRLAQALNCAKRNSKQLTVWSLGPILTLNISSGISSVWCTVSLPLRWIVSSNTGRYRGHRHRSGSVRQSCCLFASIASRLNQCLV